MSNLSKRMLFSYLLSEIDTSKYKQKELKEKGIREEEKLVLIKEETEDERDLG